MKTLQEMIKLIPRGKLDEAKETSTTAFQRYDRFKKMFDAGNPSVTKRQLDGILNIANSLLTQEFGKKEKHLIDTHGADWWEFAKKQYPISKEDGMYVVRSNFSKDPDSGRRGPWEFESNIQAKDKVFQLVKWLDGGRKKGYGDKDEDVKNWLTKLDSLDKSKQQVREATAISPKTLADYKKAAAEAARELDKQAAELYAKGDVAGAKKLTQQADKRFSGIIKATGKQFDNDAKGIREAQEKKYEMTHANNCPWNYGHDCDCGEKTPTHNSDCGHRYGHDCDCGYDELKKKHDDVE